MSDFTDAMFGLLPEHSNLHKPSNEVRKVIERTLGVWLDENADVPGFWNQMFLTTSTGKYLDLHGRDYGVKRGLDESDEDYRKRIVFEKLEYLIADNLRDFYDVLLYIAYDGFNPLVNDLTSSNLYRDNFYCGIAEEDTIQIINNKFILDNEIVWLHDHGLDYIYDINDNPIINRYKSMYLEDNLKTYFRGNTNIKTVSISLPACTNAFYMFSEATNLEYVHLVLPFAKRADAICSFCTNLETAILYLPGITEQLNFPFYYCTNLKNIDITIPEEFIESFMQQLEYSQITSLESLIINGDEVEL